MITTRFSTSSNGTSDRPPPCGSGGGANAGGGGIGSAGAGTERSCRVKSLSPAQPERGAGGGRASLRGGLHDRLVQPRGRQPRVWKHRVRQPGAGHYGALQSRPLQLRHSGRLERLTETGPREATGERVEGRRAEGARFATRLVARSEAKPKTRDSALLGAARNISVKLPWAGAIGAGGGSGIGRLGTAW